MGRAPGSSYIYYYPCISHIMKYTTGWESNWKKAPILCEKYEYQFPRFFRCDGSWGFSHGLISKAFSTRRVFLTFPKLWKGDEKTHAFPIWWSIPQDGNLIEKKYPFYWKCVGTNFPGFPYSMGFAVFSDTFEN